MEANDILMAGIASNVRLGRPEPGPTSSRLKELHRDPRIFMRHRVRHRRVRDCFENRGYDILMAGIASNVRLGRPEPGPHKFLVKGVAP
jgi:hypothetical protein